MRSYLVNNFHSVIRNIAFNGMPVLFNPNFKNIPKPILHIINKDIKTHLARPKPTTNIIANNKPIIAFYPSLSAMLNNSCQITEYGDLARHVDSISASNKYRDITILPPGKDEHIAIVRTWYKYIPETKLIKLVNVYESCDSFKNSYVIDYYNTIMESEFAPKFIDKLQPYNGFGKKYYGDSEYSNIQLFMKKLQAL